MPEDTTQAGLRAGGGQPPAGTPVSAAGLARPQQPGWPARTGAIPPLAEGFSARPDTAPGLVAALVPGAVVALVPGAAATWSGTRPEPCGKTQLAVFAAESLWRSRQVDLLAWVAANSRASVLSGYQEAAAAAGIDLAGPAEQVAARLHGWLRETGRPWLVVLDDLRDAADLDGLWPPGPAGRVLVTTSASEAILGHRAQMLPVGAFSDREALNYLRARLATDPEQRSGAVDLAAELSGEPSALAQASAVIATSRLSCCDYQEHYASRRTLLAGQGDGQRPAAGAVTWALSAWQAGRLSHGGATGLLLALAAVLDGGQIPGPVLATPAACAFLAQAGGPADPEHAWDAVLALERAGLLATGSPAGPPAIWMSRVVAARVRAAVPAQMLERAALAAADALLESWPADEPVPWLAADLRFCAARLQHAAADLLWAGDRCHPLLLTAGRSIDGARLTGPAVSYWAQLAATSERVLGPDHPDSLMIGGRLARALLAAGQAAEAVAWSQRVVASHARRSGPGHPATLAALVGLGHVLAAAGQAGHAVTVLEQAVAGYERTGGPGDPGALSARDELGAVCQAAGRPGDAIRHYRRILAAREHGQGPRHADTITARGKLAAACLADGQIKNALSYFKRVLADRENTLGPGHLDTITARRDLAFAHHAAGRMATALQLYEQACAGYEQILGPGHPEALARRAELANAYFDAGRLADSVPLLRDTLSRCEQALPAGDPLTRSLRQSLSEAAGQ